MKKLSLPVLVVCLLCFFSCSFAESQKIQLGTTSLYLTLGEDFTLDTEESTSSEEGDADVTAYYYNSDMDVAICQFPADGYSAETYAAKWAQQTGAGNYTVAEFGGIPVYWFTFPATDDNGRSIVAYCFLAEDAGQIVEVDFYMLNDNIS